MGEIEYHVGSERWVEAQKAELKWWLAALKDIPRKGSLAQDFRVYAHDRMDKIMKVHKGPERTDLIGALVLEVGSGPIPLIIDWNTAKKRVAIDPLFPMYHAFTRFQMCEKNMGVWCYPIKAENFKYWKPDKFDCIICSNVLDHCDDPEQVVRMMLDNLDLDGAIFLDLFLRKPETCQGRHTDMHPHGWETIEEFAKFIDPILDNKFVTEYARVFRDNNQDRLFLRLVYK